MNNFWGDIANNTSWLWIGFMTGAVFFTDKSFWLLFLGEIVGLFVIWVICATLDSLFGDPYEKK